MLRVFSFNSPYAPTVRRTKTVTAITGIKFDLNKGLA